MRTTPDEHDVWRLTEMGLLSFGAFSALKCSFWLALYMSFVFTIFYSALIIVRKYLDLDVRIGYLVGGLGLASCSYSNQISL